MTLNVHAAVAADDKKVARQFSKGAKIKALTEQLRQKHGTTITRKELKAFEKNHKLVVQWVARREEPVQKFRTPLGFVRSGRGAYAIPVDPTVLVNETGVPVTVTAPEVLPDPPLSADEQDEQDDLQAVNDVAVYGSADYPRV